MPWPRAPRLVTVRIRPVPESISEQTAASERSRCCISRTTTRSAVSDSGEESVSADTRWKAWISSSRSSASA